MAVPFSLDPAKFREAYPEFCDVAVWTNAKLQMYWDTATNFIANCNYGWMKGSPRELAINLMVAHLAKLSALIAAGQTPGIVTGSTIDKISVTLEPPLVKNKFDYWLSLTPYGQELLALLGVWSVGGWSAGGSFTRSGLRGNGIPLWG